jgi:hypothetical protein
MNDEQFERLVARLEPLAQGAPRAYRTRVFLLAMAGYAYVAAVLAGTTLLLAGSLLCIRYLHYIGVKLTLVFGAFLVLVVRAMWVRLEPPAGLAVGRREAPELHALIDSLRQQLAAPAFDEVLITGDFNAGVAQSPRLGLPLYVLCFLASPWWKLHRQARAQAVQQAILAGVEFPGETIVVWRRQQPWTRRQAASEARRAPAVSQAQRYFR